MARTSPTDRPLPEIHTAPGVALLAPAKINLSLSVGARRDDGYHDIESVMCAVSLFDRIELRPAEDLYLEIVRNEYAMDIPADEHNLVLKAALLLQRRLGVDRGHRRGAVIRLEKAIPVGAGLGGGSSDAAAVLLGLMSLWRVPSQPDLVQDAAAQIGSDVPFFLSGGCRVARGRGEILSPVPMLPDCAIVIGSPPFKVETADAYRLMSSPDRSLRSSEALTATLTKGDLQEIGRHLANDFEEVIFPRFPLLAELKAAALRAGAAGCALSGSGSALFALAEEEAAAQAIADSWAGKVKVLLARPIPTGIRQLMEGVGSQVENT